MAAHIVTALEQVKAHVEVGRPIAGLHLKGALELSCWTEDLDLDDYRALVHLAEEQNPCSMLKWVDAALVKYRRVWEVLEQPETREQWRDRYYWTPGMQQMVRALGNKPVPCTCEACEARRAA